MLRIGFKRDHSGWAVWLLPFGYIFNRYSRSHLIVTPWWHWHSHHGSAFVRIRVQR